MQKYEVLDSIPECYKKEYIGAGTNGVCYKTSQGEVFKEFKGTFTFGRDIEELVKIQSPFFAFLKKHVIIIPCAFGVVHQIFICLGSL